MADFILNKPSHSFARVFGNPVGDPVLLKSRGVTLLRDTVYGIVCGLKHHLGDKNSDEALNPLDADDKRHGKLSTLFSLVWCYLFRG